MKLYINGELDSEQEFTGGVQASTLRALSIGSSEPFELNFNGALDDARIYNYALSQDDIQLMQTGISGSPIPADSPEASPPAGGDIVTGSSCSDNPFFCYTQPECEAGGFNWCQTEIGGFGCKEEC